jgi:hypothetical protein
MASWFALALVAAGPHALVTVPTSTDSATCRVWEAAAGRLELEGSMWVERAAASPDMDLQRSATGWTLRIRSRGSAHTAPLDHPPGLAATVRAVEQAFALSPRPLVDIAPSPVAWARACDGRAEAWDAIGHALTPALFRTALPPPPRRSGSVWPWADALLNRSRVRTAPLNDFARFVEAGGRLPHWREGAPTPRSSLVGHRGSRVVVYADGRFRAVDVRTGTELGATSWGENLEFEPTLIAAGDRDLLVASDRILTFPLTSDGPAPSFDLRQPFSEVGRDEFRLYAANRDTLWALDPRTGRSAWRTDLVIRPVAGPVLTRDAVLLPEEDALVAFDPRTGRRTHRLRFDDDLSAPPLAATDGPVWVLLGARSVVAVSPGAERILARFDDAGSIGWPPVPIGSRLFALVRGGGSQLWAMHTDGTKDRLARRAEGPLLWAEAVGLLLHRSGRDLVARGPIGEPRWELRLPPNADHLAVHGGLAVVGAQREASWVDLRQGKIVARVELAEPIRDLMVAEAGAVAITEAEVVVGLPHPDHLPRWRRAAALARARASFEVGARSRARSIVDDLLVQRPDDLAARAERARATVPVQLAPWLAVLELAPPGSALRREAMDATRSSGLERHGFAPAPRLDAATSTPTVSGDVRLSRREDGYWLLRSDGSEKRITPRNTALPLALEGGFALVSGRRVYGVDAERGRLLGPVSLSEEPRRVRASGDAVAAETAPDRLEVVAPIAVRRRARFELGTSIDAWSFTEGKIFASLSGGQWVLLTPTP